jgi:26S proteasome regulatory subunit N2
MAHGIIDAGGRNVTLSLASRAGFTKATAVVGVALWTQYWYWFPMQHMLGLSFSPTALICLNKDLAMPKSFTVLCAAKPSMFAYPKMTEAKKEEKKERVATVSLSTTARAKAREAKKDKAADKAEDAKMDEAKDEATTSATDEAMSSATDEATTSAKDEAKEDEGASEEKGAKKKRVPEPTSFALPNPSRVTPEQERFVSFDPAQRYAPVNPRSKPAGIVILVDRTPEEPEDVAQVRCLVARSYLVRRRVASFWLTPFPPPRGV